MLFLCFLSLYFFFISRFSYTSSCALFLIPSVCRSKYHTLNLFPFFFSGYTSSFARCLSPSCIVFIISRFFSVPKDIIFILRILVVSHRDVVWVRCLFSITRRCRRATVYHRKVARQRKKKNDGETSGEKDEARARDPRSAPRRSDVSFHPLPSLFSVFVPLRSVSFDNGIPRGRDGA